MSYWFSLLILLLICTNNVKSDSCGQRSPIIRQLVSYGNHSRHGEWPWHAAVMHRMNQAFPSYACGGTIISSNYILTAGHCVYPKNRVRRLKAKEIVIRAGITNIKELEHSFQEMPVEKIILHEDYNSETSESDIALVKLHGELQITNYVKSICLWRDRKDEQLIVGKLGYVVGWGSDEHGVNQDHLQHTVMPIISRKQCKNSDPDYYLRYLFDGIAFCAGFRNGTSTGLGDSGGGLYIELDGRWILRGITSNGKFDVVSQRLDTSSFIIFTDVANFISWIDNVTAVNNEATNQNVQVHGNMKESQLSPPFNSSSIASLNGCGHRNKEGILSFKIGNHENNESQFGEFPWMVEILAEDRTNSSSLICGGSLIDPEVVVTTAHCVKSYKSKPEKLIIRAGEWDMGSTNEPIGFEERRVRSIKTHPGFRSTSLINNIALLFLDDKFVLSVTINTVCLPPEGFAIENGTITATGWGSTAKDRSKYQQILKSFDLQYTQRAECERILRRATNIRTFKLDKSFICAGGEPDVDTCKGDAGSPIITAIPNDSTERYYAIGMVSWGVGCGRPGIPAAYTDIRPFRNWIDHQVEAEDLNVHNYEYEKQSAMTE